MIDKKKIKAAAKAYEKEVNAECKKLNDKLSCGKNELSFTYKSPDACFADGAKWAIKEFLQNLWKGPEIKPKSGSNIIAISKKNMPYVFCNVEIPNVEIPNWKHLMKFHNIERWCYLDDILSWKGGER